MSQKVEIQFILDGSFYRRRYLVNHVSIEYSSDCHIVVICNISKYQNTDHSIECLNNQNTDHSNECLNIKESLNMINALLLDINKELDNIGKKGVKNYE